MLIGDQRVSDLPLARRTDHQDAQVAHLAEMLRHILGQAHILGEHTGLASPRDLCAGDRKHDGVATLLNGAQGIEAARQVRAAQAVPESNTSQTRRPRSLWLEKRS